MVDHYALLSVWNCFALLSVWRKKFKFKNLNFFLLQTFASLLLICHWTFILIFTHVGDKILFQLLISICPHFEEISVLRQGKWLSPAHFILMELYSKVHLIHPFVASWWPLFISPFFHWEAYWCLWLLHSLSLFWRSWMTSIGFTAGTSSQFKGLGSPSKFNSYPVEVHTISSSTLFLVEFNSCSTILCTCLYWAFI